MATTVMWRPHYFKLHVPPHRHRHRGDAQARRLRRLLDNSVNGNRGNTLGVGGGGGGEEEWGRAAELALKIASSQLKKASNLEIIERGLSLEIERRAQVSSCLGPHSLYK